MRPIIKQNTIIAVGRPTITATITIGGNANEIRTAIVRHTVNAMYSFLRKSARCQIVALFTDEAIAIMSPQSFQISRISKIMEMMPTKKVGEIHVVTFPDCVIGIRNSIKSNSERNTNQ